MSTINNQYDVIVIGGGPAGATAALVLARAGLRVIALEKTKFPRFHIGESLLPRALPLIQKLGLESVLRTLPHMPKLGAEFGMGNDRTTVRFTFDQGLLPGSPTVNLSRAEFDEFLLQQASAAGAQVRQSARVDKILELKDDAVRVNVEGQEIRGRYLIDASGCATVVARHLGIRRTIADRNLQKVAYFQHFEQVRRLPGAEVGHPGIFMGSEGWFWLIALDARRTSVGFVAQPGLIKQVGVAADDMLAWAVARCPAVRNRMTHAVGLTTNHILADFSYMCRPYAGPGYFLVGDAAAFLDPVFSTGVTMAMMSAFQAAERVISLVRDSMPPARARSQYIRFVDDSSRPLWRLVRQFYEHSFRELFLNGTGPFQVHKAVISVLAGQVFPKPVWSLRWRLWLFDLFVAMNKFIPLVPRRAEFSLLNSEPIPWPSVAVASPTYNS